LSERFTYVRRGGGTFPLARPCACRSLSCGRGPSAATIHQSPSACGASRMPFAESARFAWAFSMPVYAEPGDEDQRRQHHHDGLDSRSPAIPSAITFVIGLLNHGPLRSTMG